MAPLAANPVSGCLFRSGSISGRLERIPAKAAAPAPNIALGPPIGRGQRDGVMRMLPEIVLMGLLAAASAPPAFSWAAEGHRIIARIAEENLTPAARANVRRLLPGEDGDELASVADWPDQVRSALPFTDPWHYVDIPSSAEGYVADRDCPRGACVVAKIEEYSAVLADAGRSPAERREALVWLVHLVGDIHQPLHAIGDARGGNDIEVTFFGAQLCGRRVCNLHAVWDFGMIERYPGSEAQYAGKLEESIASRSLTAGPMAPELWADESFDLARRALVAPETDLGFAYFRQEGPVMDRQLALAGLRLAALLNRDLGSP